MNRALSLQSLFLFTQHTPHSLFSSLSDPFPPTLDFLQTRMDSLELPRLLLHHPRSSSPLTRPQYNSRFLPQLPNFPSKLKNATKYATLRSISGGGSDASKDGPSAFDDDSALLLSREIDDFGSLVGFRLIPDSGTCLSFSFPLF